MVLSAHPTPNSTIFLDVTDLEVKVEAEMPLDQLHLAAPELSLPGVSRLDAEQKKAIQSYLMQHIAVRTPRGDLFRVKVQEVDLQMEEGQPHHLNASLLFQPVDSAKVGSFTFEDQAILHRVVSHKIYVVLRRDSRQDISPDHPRFLDAIRHQHTQILIDRSGDSL